MIDRNQGVNNTALKYRNQILILDKIKSKGEISRAQLSKILGLSAPSISKNIELLLDKGIIIEAGTGESSGGRRPVVLKYNYDFCYIVGVILKEDGLKAALTKLNGEIIHEIKISKSIKKMKEEEIIEEIISSTNTLSEVSKIDIGFFKCISISLPGIIKDNEIIVSNIIPQIQGKRLSDAIIERLNTDVQIKNDINSKVIGEYWELSEELKNIVYMSPENTGVGAGIIIDGKLYEGSFFGAGEVGYMTFEVEEVVSKTKKIDYLEKIVSGERLTQIIEKLASEAGSDIYTGLIDEEGKVNYKVLKLATEDGNPIALETYKYLARYYAMAIQNIGTLLNPDTIILGGNFVKLGPLMHNLIKKYLDHISIISIDTKLAKSNFDSELNGVIYFGIKYIDEKILSI